MRLSSMLGHGLSSRVLSLRSSLSIARPRNSANIFKFTTTATTASLTGVFRTTSETDEITVDWGDGSALGTFAGTSNQAYSHTYSSAGVYTVKISNAEVMTRFTITNSSSGIICTTKALPSGLTYFSCYNTKSILTGDIANLPSGLNFFSCSATKSTISQYTSGRSWTASMNTIGIYTVSGGLSTAEVDNLLIDLAKTTWTGSKIISITGTSESRSSASNTAVATLTSKGVTVTTP